MDQKVTMDLINRPRRIAGSDFRTNLVRWGQECADAFIDRGISLNDSIVKIARQNSLNKEQVKRLIQEVNSVTFLRLYDKTKGKALRRPSFDIARYDQLKGRLPQCESEPDTDSCVKAASDEMEKTHKEKVAELKQEVGLSSQWLYKMGSLLIEGHDSDLNKRLSLIKKVTKIGNELLEKEATSSEKFFKQIKIVGESLIKCAQLEGNENEVFNELCKDASLEIFHQAPLVSYIDKVLEMRKEAGAIPKNFSVDFTIRTPGNKLSLQEHSLIKTAARKPKVPTLTVEDVLVQDYEDLLNKAQNLVQAQVKMIEDYEAIEKFKEKIRNKGMDVLEDDKDEEDSAKS